MKNTRRTDTRQGKETRNANRRRIVMSSILVAGIGIGTVSYLLRPAQNALNMMATRNKGNARPATAGTLASGVRKNTGTSSAAGLSSNAVSAAMAQAASNSAGTSGATAQNVAANGTQVAYGMSDGIYVGRREYAFYGYVKVKAIVQNGKLQKVQVLEHPNDNGTSRYINSIAMPYLVQEAVQAQNSNVSLISGATLSSEAFVKSLNSALSQAGA